MVVCDLDAAQCQARSSPVLGCSASGWQHSHLAARRKKEVRHSSPPPKHSTAHPASAPPTIIAALQATVDFIHNSCGTALALPGDVTDPAFPARAVAAAVEAYGGLHILVNCAGEEGLQLLRAVWFAARERVWWSKRRVGAGRLPALLLLLRCPSVALSLFPSLQPGHPAADSCPCCRPVTCGLSPISASLLCRAGPRPHSPCPTTHPRHAGFTWDGMIHKMGEKQWETMLSVHCTAPFRLIQASMALREGSGVKGGWPGEGAGSPMQPQACPCLLYTCCALQHCLLCRRLYRRLLRLGVPPVVSPPLSPAVLLQAAAPHMREAAKKETAACGRPRPRCILNVSSVSGEWGGWMPLAVCFLPAREQCCERGSAASSTSLEISVSGGWVRKVLGAYILPATE